METVSNLFGRGKGYQTMLLMLLFVLLTNGFNFVRWPLPTGTLQKNLAVLILLLFLARCRLSRSQHFRYHVLLLAILPFLSVYYSRTEYGQPFFDGIKATLPSLSWLSYFLLHRLRWREGSIMRAFLYVALFLAAVQVIQQLTYPYVFFGTASAEEIEAGEELVSQRNGLWRFRLGMNGYFTAIVLFAVWEKIKRRLQGLSFVLFAVMLISIYLTLTRQVIFSAMLTLALSFFMGRGGMKMRSLAIGLMIFGVVANYSDLLFAEFANMTREDATKNYIRILSATYYWRETFSSLKATLLGHGMAFSGYFLSMYEDLKETFHFFVSDVGFIGMMWRFGLPYVVVCYSLLASLFWTWRRWMPTDIRLFVMFVTVMSVMIFPMSTTAEYILWCLILYICDMHINALKK